MTKHLLPALVLAALLILLAACGGPRIKANPDFENCMTACTKTRNDCMVNATSAADINSCNANQTGCAKSCEDSYPRHIKVEPK